MGFFVFFSQLTELQQVQLRVTGILLQQFFSELLNQYQRLLYWKNKYMVTETRAAFYNKTHTQNVITAVRPESACCNKWIVLFSFSPQLSHPLTPWASTCRAALSQPAATSPWMAPLWESAISPEWTAAPQTTAILSNSTLPRPQRWPLLWLLVQPFWLLCGEAWCKI